MSLRFVILTPNRHTTLFLILLLTTYSVVHANDLQPHLPTQFANTNITLDDAKTLLRDKCIKVADNEEKGVAAFINVETASDKLVECVTEIFNYTAIQTEIEEANPYGELDVVFNKYCKKRPQALECIEAFNAHLIPCLEADEQASRDVFMRIVRSLLNFVCHRDGDQIALFIAEKGPECLESKKNDIHQCINNTFAGYLPNDGLKNVKLLPTFVLGEQQCEEIERLELCIVGKLELCEEITPANIVESLFRFVKREKICRNTNFRLGITASANKWSFNLPYALTLTLAAILYSDILFVRL